MNETLVHERNAQKAAEEHLDRCYRALDGDETAFEGAEHQPSHRFCGCTRCIVREVLESSFNHILEIARAEVRALDSGHREALERIHDGLADHPLWHNTAPRYNGPMDVVNFIRGVLGVRDGNEHIREALAEEGNDGQNV